MLNIQPLFSLHTSVVHTNTLFLWNGYNPNSLVIQRSRWRHEYRHIEIVTKLLSVWFRERRHVVDVHSSRTAERRKISSLFPHCRFTCVLLGLSTGCIHVPVYLYTSMNHEDQYSTPENLHYSAYPVVASCTALAPVLKTTWVTWYTRLATRA